MPTPHFFIEVRFFSIKIKTKPEIIKLVIDEKTLEQYEKYYFVMHPRAKKRPIESPHHPSMNKWMIMRRPMMNQLKQKIKDFIVWFINENNLNNMVICECDMEFTSYFKTRIRHDPDNNVPKFYLDGLADSGFIMDDDGAHLRSLTLKCGYDKENPRTEILIYNIKY